MRKFLERKHQLRRKRTLRVRKKLSGTALKPRLCVRKTNCHIYADLVDDEAGHTLASISTLAKEFRQAELDKKNRTTARKIGEHIGEIAREKGIQEVVFDRRWARYHGVLAEVADGARGTGLKF